MEGVSEHEDTLAGGVSTEGEEQLKSSSFETMLYSLYVCVVLLVAVKVVKILWKKFFPTEKGER
tara:strand:+ start:318 stop:509 length:192 start_codon:yes stop_codon:yes gene_type:complete